MTFRPLAWLQSLHAKLFTVVALITSFLTVLVAVQITRNSREEWLKYSKKLAIEAGEVVETEIQQRDPEFKDSRKIKEVLESLAGDERSVFQIDVFKREPGGLVSLVTSSIDETEVDWEPDLGHLLNEITKSMATEVLLNTGNHGWKVYSLIDSPRQGKPAIGLIRVYCDMERWEVVWRKNRNRTYKQTLPLVLLGEFILLWVITSVFVKDPLQALAEAMKRLQQGDPKSRTHIRRKDELGLIASQFNEMAENLDHAAQEREMLIEEIRNLNAGLQDRINAALAELQAKNEELQQLMERIALLRDELAQQERLAIAGQLTAAFAHEVGTPLNLVNSHLQLLLQSQEELPEKARERMNTIHAQIERVGDIVRRMLGLTRKPQLKQEIVSLASLVADLKRLWTPTLIAHQVRFSLEAPDPCMLFVDRKQMEQLFINLVNNAVDAMPKGGHIYLRVTHDQDSDTGRWRVVVEDDGMGIPPEILPKVFKPMFTTKPEGKGTGLGLAICREVVRSHGGEIRVESREGEGTTFFFTLPSASNVTAEVAVG